MIRAFSILRVIPGGKTGRVSRDPGTGSFHVLSISSSLRRVTVSTSVYAFINVWYMFRPRKRVYGVPTFLTIESTRYSAGSLYCGGVYRSS